MKAMRNSEEQAKPMCGRCGRVFSTYHYLSQHSARKHGVAASETVCSICRVDFTSYQDYKIHTLNAHDQIVQTTSETQAVCGICSGSYWAMHIWSHIRVSHLDRSDLSTECKVCGQLVNKKDLKAHNEEKHSSIPCHRCSEVFCSLIAYSNHFSSTHRNIEKATKKVNSKQIRCGLCSQLFNTTEKITRHIYSVHLGRIPVHFTMCMYCCQVLPLTEQSTHLNSEHVRIQCLLCNKSFSRAGYNYHFNYVHI